MTWPSHSDYQDAMQNPGVCFQEPELKTGEAATDMLGLPRVMSGNFASVYELTTPKGHWAIRCFVRQVSGQQGRYARLSEHLNSLNVPYLVKFEYLLKGILVRGEWFPIVKMQWVDGLPLNTFIDENHENPQAMLKLASDFREVLKSMRDLKIAHGDLQHGNIMVTSKSEIRLVDYDGMYAPVFGRGRAPELGHASFQHPRRTADFYEENLDNFAALVIYTSFRALAKEPELWKKFYTVDNLLLSSSDFKAPLQSPVFEALQKNPDVQVQQLAKLLVKASCGGVEQVPDFETVMKALDEGTIEKVELKSVAAPTTGEPLKQKLEALKTRGAPATKPPGEMFPKPASREATTKTRAAAGTTPVVAASKPDRTPFVPPEEKSGLPSWAVWVGGIIALAAIAFFIHIGRDQKEDNETPDVTAPVAQTPATTTPVTGDSKSAPGKLPPPTPTQSGQHSLLGTLRGHTSAVKVLAFSPDGKLLATGGWDKKLLLWDATAGKTFKSINSISESINSVTFTSDGKNVAVVTSDNTVQLWDTATGEKPRSFTNYTDSLFTVALSPQGQHIATAGADRKAINLANFETGAVVRNLTGHSSWVKAVNFSQEGNFLISVSHDDTITLWDINKGQKLQTLTSPGNGTETAVISPDGKFAALASDSRMVRIVDVGTGVIRQTLSGHGGEVTCYSFAPSRRSIATGSADKTIRIWDYRTGGQLQTLSGHSQALSAIRYSRDGKLLASASVDGIVKLWEVR